MNDPKITVLMPVYNAGKFIREAISSVLEQTFTNYELLIVNDGSTDETTAVINSFHDDRIRIIHQPNKGVAAALNNGLRHARAAYIARFDGDDICYPDRLQIQYEFITAHPSYSLIGSAVDYVDVNGKYIFTYRPAAHSSEAMFRGDFSVCPFIHSSVLYRKDAVTAIGGYNEYAYTFEDHLLWVNLLQKEDAINLQQVLIKVRLNPESITIDEKWRPSRFRRIKYEALEKCNITRTEGEQLQEIGKKQRLQKIKEGSYHSLLGKKYLWNNYQPSEARRNFLRVLSLSPFHLRYYLLLLLSFFPEKSISTFYQFIKRKLGNIKNGFTNGRATIKKAYYGG